MPSADNPDVTSTLAELERKLVDLERELGAVTGGGDRPPAPASEVSPASAAPPRDPVLRVEDLRGEIADLVRFRDQLEAAAHELVSEYDRLVERLRGNALPVGAPPEPPPPPSDAPQTGPVPHPTPASPARLAPPAHAETSFGGAVVVDAGPFTDIAGLQAFEQALARVDGAEDVYVRSFEGNRALIDVRLSNPVPLVRLLREQLTLPITAREAGGDRLTVDVAADSHGT